MKASLNQHAYLPFPCLRYTERNADHAFSGCRLQVSYLGYINTVQTAEKKTRFLFVYTSRSEIGLLRGCECLPLIFLFLYITISPSTYAQTVFYLLVQSSCSTALYSITFLHKPLLQWKVFIIYKLNSFLFFLNSIAFLCLCSLVYLILSCLLLKQLNFWVCGSSFISSY